MAGKFNRCAHSAADWVRDCAHLAVVLLLAGAAARCAWAKPPGKPNAGKTTGVPYEGLSAQDLKSLVGATVDVVPRSGKTFSEVELVQLTPGKQPGTLQSIGFKPADGGAKRTLPAKTLARLVVGTRVCEVMPDHRQKNAFLLVDLQSRDALVKAKLKLIEERRYALWPKLTDPEQAKALEENKAFLKKIDDAIPNRQFKLHETTYYLFYSDIPAGSITPVIADVDNMYLTLGRKFGVYDGENIWHGKAMIAVFSTSDLLARFEKIVMDVDDVADYRCFFHRLGKGDTLVACHASGDPNDFISILIRDTARGYLFRYRSNVEVPAWIREGVAEWVAGSVLPGDKMYRRRQELAVETVPDMGNLAGFFKHEQFDQSWQWGVAGAMTDILLKTDPQAYRQFIQGIKEGQAWQEALRDSFGLSSEDLVHLYGQQIGLPNLRP